MAYEIVTEPETGWKFLDLMDGQIRSRHGYATWKVGEWEHVEGYIQTCNRGFHSSPTAIAAMNYVPGDVLARVEGKGKVSREGGSMPKSAYADMRIVEAYHWTPQDAAAFAVFIAEKAAEDFDVIHKDREDTEDHGKALKAALKAAKDSLADPESITEDELREVMAAAYDHYGWASYPVDYLLLVAYYAAAAALAIREDDAQTAISRGAGVASYAGYVFRTAAGGEDGDASIPPEVEDWIQERIKTLTPVTQ